VTGRVHRASVALAALWPMGVGLAVAHQEVDAMTTPVYLVLGATYVAVGVALLRRLGLRRSDPYGVLAMAPVALFAVGGFTGAPSGRDPDLLLVNSAILVAVALALPLAAMVLLLRHRRSPAAGHAAIAIALLLVGTAGYLVNLLGRFAVVLTGLEERQARVEDHHWDASEYLRGLPPEADPLAYLLTWMDLVQLAYVVTAYVAAAGLARLLSAEGALSAGVGRIVERCGWAFAGLLGGSVALALTLPHGPAAVPAGLAFALSIPFMTTLLPFAVAVDALRLRAGRELTGADPRSVRPSRPGARSLPRP
jgi:hypothetical protein